MGIKQFCMYKWLMDIGLLSPAKKRKKKVFKKVFKIKKKIKKIILLLYPKLRI